jgi:sigma-B regulation protein RsbU (phosphoserine phosphatase)
VRPVDGAETIEDLFENAPCGYVSTMPDGRIVRVNATLEQWLGMDREALSERRFRDLLTVGGRIYYETHFAPLLAMQGRVQEIALDLRRADGSLLPALINSVMSADADGQPSLIRTTVFDATDRRRYERELLGSREREHAIAQELQRSLLAGDLPADERAEIAVVYRPAVAGLEVGGDWYDAFWTVDGVELTIVVGDVVGRGIEAAAMMGQLRSVVRALAGMGLSPAAVLDGLERFVERHGVGDMATVACAQVNLETRQLRFACAGHPPPAILEPGRPPRLAWEGRSTPLAALDGPRPPRAEAELVLAAGATVLLFTDGLFERRDRSLADGLDALLGQAAARSAASVAELAEGVVAEMADDRLRGDDVCLLALRLGQGPA